MTLRRVLFFQKLCKLVSIALEKHGIVVAIFWLIRTSEQQQGLYRIGRTEPGKIVTNCDGINTHSKHEKWEAADLCVIDPKTNAWIWARIEDYEILGKIAKELGLRWGGDWDGDEIRDPTDYDIYHFELP